jgi:hypothetical protein
MERPHVPEGPGSAAAKDEHKRAAVRRCRGMVEPRARARRRPEINLAPRERCQVQPPQIAEPLASAAGAAKEPDPASAQRHRMPVPPARPLPGAVASLDGRATVASGQCEREKNDKRRKKKKKMWVIRHSTSMSVHVRDAVSNAQRSACTRISPSRASGESLGCVRSPPPCTKTVPPTDAQACADRGGGETSSLTPR